MIYKQPTSVLEAVDHLSSMVDVDLAQALKLSIEGKTFTIPSKVNWMDPKEVLHNQNLVKETFTVFLTYFKDLYNQDPENFKNIQVVKGIQAIMLLVSEAAQKIDRFTALFKNAQEIQSIFNLPEYRELQKFYLTHVIQPLQKSLQEQMAFKNPIPISELPDKKQEKQIVKDIESVKLDRVYELFTLKQENGTVFFNSDLFRHVQWIGNVDEMLLSKEGEELFLMLQTLQDREVHEGAIEILNLAKPYIEQFYKEAFHLKNDALIALLNKALMALMMSANPRNLLETSGKKSCLFYYADFHFYLRSVLDLNEYHQLISSFEQANTFSRILLNLVHALCCFFFMRIAPRNEAIKRIKELIAKGEATKKSLETNESMGVSKGLSIWHSLLEKDEHLRYLLKNYPNGPLLKTFEVFNENISGFDPIKQRNYPAKLYSLFQEEFHITIARIPSPTNQTVINQAEINSEFLGYLRYLNQHKDKHLLINLQDRTSWKEHSRCMVLEKLQNQEEFSENFICVTLSKDSDFYKQEAEYASMKNSLEFKETFQKLLLDNFHSGFFFPESIQLSDFMQQTMNHIHRDFFHDKESLNKEERLCFIEIFYQFLILKLIEVTGCDLLSFTCKDALDTGAVANMGFFSFIRLMSRQEVWKEEEKDFLLWLLYSFALMVRERAVDFEHLSRMVNALSKVQEGIDTNRHEILSNASQLFSKIRFEKIQIEN